MSMIRAVWSELVGLFVDDGLLALSVVAWVLACGVVLPHLGLPTAVPPALLFVGLVLILASSVVRHARPGRNARRTGRDPG